MSRVSQLIQHLCPNGVSLVPLSDVGVWYGGGTPSKGRPEYWTDGTIPWVSPKDMGRRVVDSSIDKITEAAVLNSATKLVPPTSIAIVVRSSILDHTFPTALVPIPVALNQDMKAVVPRSDVQVEYLAHMLSSRGRDILLKASKSGGSVTSIGTSQLMSYRIPVPPLPIQLEIVRILDQFTQLEAELEAELEARRAQLSYYRGVLALGNDDAPQVPLGEIADFKYGFTDKADTSGTHRFLRITDITPEGKLSIEDPKYISFDSASDYVVQPGDLLMARTGATFGKTMLVGATEPSVYASFLIRIRFKNGVMLPAYYWHFAQSTAFWDQANALVSTGGQPQFNANVLKLLKVPVPSITVQRRVVQVLDQFDALANDLSIGLPAELVARRKQYEYYRDRLLTFKELEV